MGWRGGGEMPNCPVQNAAFQMYKSLKRGEINDAGSCETDFIKVTLHVHSKLLENKPF